jgi:hypothetical protein
MGLQEMVKDMQQGQDVLLVAASLCLPDIIDNYVPNFFAAVLLGQKVLSECCCSDFGKVFVLCDGEHLLLLKALEACSRLKAKLVIAKLEAGSCSRKWSPSPNWRPV